MEITDLRIKAKKISELNEFPHYATTEDLENSFVVIGYKNGNLAQNYKISLSKLIENLNLNNNSDAVIDEETIKDKIIELINNGTIELPRGPIGRQGPMGEQGDPGVQGRQGIIGKQGPQGDNGIQGPRGYQGLEGFQGRQGRQGTQGYQGKTGIQGWRGEIGPQGYQGKQGPRGRDGNIGGKGFQGTQGSQGAKGDSGIVDPSLLNNLATKTFVNDRISDLINGAPEALDTLKEISDALNNDPDVISVLIEKINGIQSMIEDNPPAPTSYRINYHLTNVIRNESIDTISVGGRVTLSFTPNNGYVMPENVIVGGAIKGNYDKIAGTLEIYNPTREVSITINGVINENITYYFDFVADDIDGNDKLTYDENGSPNGIKSTAVFKYSNLNRCPINYNEEYDFSENWYGNDKVWIIVPSKYLKSQNSNILLDDNNNEYHIATGTARYDLPFDEIYSGTYLNIQYSICLIGYEGLADIISFKKIN